MHHRQEYKGCTEALRRTSLSNDTGTVTIEKPVGIHRPKSRTLRTKCAVIGCGFVGATTAFSLVQSELFSSMVLIDIDTHKAEGEAADLSHAGIHNIPQHHAGTAMEKQEVKGYLE